MFKVSVARTLQQVGVVPILVLAGFLVGCPLGQTQAPPADGTDQEAGQPSPEDKDELAIEGQGSVDQVVAGNLVTLTAVADSAWVFDCWFGPTTSTLNPITVAIDRTPTRVRFIPDDDDDGVPNGIDVCPGFDDNSDADADGVADGCDACPNDAEEDVDGDGICANLDNCPEDANPGQEDEDEDGLGDACDECQNDPNNDADNDGVCARVDNCPEDANPGQEDEDEDGLGDACDSCPNDDTNDVDNDGHCEDVDNCPNHINKTQADTDNDGAGDACDLCPNDPDKIEPGQCGCGAPDTDSDQDGTLDCSDTCPNDPDKTEPGQCDCGTPDTDSDQDGTPDCSDTCPNDPDKTEPGQCDCGNPDTDSDNDGTADCVDTCPNDPDNDSDNDDVCGDVDNCPTASNATQADADQDGAGDACDLCPNDADNDSDSDGVCGDVDNCPADANSDQTDDDGDGIGNVCEPDADGDGVPDDTDNCIFDSNASQTDTDGDGFGDICDVCPNDAADDADFDGVCGDVDQCPGTPFDMPVDEFGCPPSEPVALFTTEPDPPALGEPFIVDASLSFDLPDLGAVETYGWDWGDESPTDSSPLATHTYLTPGRYTVTLTVFDAETPPNSATMSRTFEIPDSPPTTWAPTQPLGQLLRMFAFPERYDLDDEGRLITAHFTVHPELLDYEGVAVIAKSVPLNAPAQLFRLDYELGQSEVLILTINSFRLTVAEDVATWDFDYVFRVTAHSFDMNLDIDVRFAGTQTGTLSAQGSEIAWHSAHGTTIGCMGDGRNAFCLHADPLVRTPFLGDWINTTGSVCGNAQVEPGEQCDPPDAVTCDSNCLLIEGVGPENDDCANPIPVTESATVFGNIGATTDGPVDLEACDYWGTPEADVWFCYTATCDGLVVANVCDAENWLTSIAVYSRCDCPTESPIACEALNCGLSGAQLTFTAEAGESYLIRVGGLHEDEQGFGTLTVFCGEPCGTESGDCFLEKESPGCNDESCCTLICDLDPYCCHVAWDEVCAAEASELCVGTFGSFEVCTFAQGDCGSDHSTPGCSDATCCETVCGLDPVCCTEAWDEVCRDIALEVCGPALVCGPNAGDCFEANGTPGCADPDCCSDVCYFDPFCCTTEWDDTCANTAVGICGPPLGNGK